VRIAVLLALEAILGYVRADPTRGLAVGELIGEIDAEADSAVAITALTLVAAHGAISDPADLTRLERLVGCCMVLPLDAADASAVADLAVHHLAEAAGGPTGPTVDLRVLSTAHDVLAAMDRGSLLFTARGNDLSKQFPGLAVLDLD
jgi:hypothetical protein